MKKSGNILIVDDNRGVLTALQLLLKPYFDKIAVLSSPVTLPATLREDIWQAVLLDMNFTSGINTGNEGLYWLHEIKKQYPALPVVLFRLCRHRPCRTGDKGRSNGFYRQALG